MATRKKEQPATRGEPPRNYQGNAANQETTIRDATDEEKPDPGTVAQFEEILPPPAP